jgi:hypothetical protein
MRLTLARLLSLVGIVVLVLSMSGCATTQDSENASVRPWNAPMGWENGLPSTMREGR